MPSLTLTREGFLLEYVKVSADRIRLEIDRVSKTYGSRQVLRSVSADLAGGDTLVVTGRNGAGKSTLLRIVAGLLRPSQGQVRYWRQGAPILPEERQQVIGFAGPDIHLYRELSAHEHIRLLARLRDLTHGDADEAALLAQVGLEGRGNEPLSTFSSGMLQRLRLALALMHQPEVLLLDEPTTNLDEAGVVLLGELVKETARDGIVIIATNDPRDIEYGELVLRLDGIDG